MNRIGIIDIGTNTTRVIVFDLDQDPPATVFEDDRVTRLGAGIAGRRLREDAIERTLAQAAEYKRRADEAGAARVMAVGTSAVRDAENRDDFIARLLALEVEPRALSGEEEAALVFRGVAAGRRGRADVPLLVLDVGGGSTEMIAGGAGAPPRGASVNVGAVRLTERFIRSDPPAPDELAAMEEHAEGEIRAALERVEPAPGAALIGVAGTVVTLAMVAMRAAVFVPEKIHGYNMSREEVERLYRLFAEATVARRRGITGMESGREDVIAAGAFLVAAAMRAAGAAAIEVSNCDLRHGILAEEMEKAEKYVVRGS